MTMETAQVLPPLGQTPAPESKEDIDAVRSQLQEALNKAKEAEDGKKKAEEEAKKHHKVATEQGRELKRLRESQLPPTQPTSLVPLKAMADELERLSQSSYAEDPAAAARLASIRKQIADEEMRQLVESREGITKTWREKLEKQIADSGLTPEDSQFEDVWDAFDIAYSVDGKFERAERKLNRILKERKSVEEKKAPEAQPKETEEEMEKRIEAKVLKKFNLLPTSTTGPSGSEPVFTEAQVADRTFWEANREAILKAQREGRIK